MSDAIAVVVAAVVAAVAGRVTARGNLNKLFFEIFFFFNLVLVRRFMFEGPGICFVEVSSLRFPSFIAETSEIVELKLDSSLESNGGLWGLLAKFSHWFRGEFVYFSDFFFFFLKSKSASESLSESPPAASDDAIVFWWSASTSRASSLSRKAECSVDFKVLVASLTSLVNTTCLLPFRM